MSGSLHKGDTVGFRSGVGRTGWIEGRRPLDRDELAAWYASPDSRGLDSAGETLLPPVSWLYRIEPDATATVLRARCRARLSYGRQTPGLALVRIEGMGDLYVKRSDIEPHAGHGRGSAEDGPDDPDCPCRATPGQRSCAAAGCGFCRAATGEVA